MQRLARKIIVALVTLALFGLLMTMLSYTESSKTYFTFWSLLELFLIMSGPILLIFGIAASYIADRANLRKRWRLLLYACIGMLIMVPYSMIFFWWSESVI